MQDEEGQDLSTRQAVEGTEEGVDLGTTSTHLKRSSATKRSGPQKKVKASKLAIDPITLIEGDLYDIGDTVHEVTKEKHQAAMLEQ